MAETNGTLLKCYEGDSYYFFRVGSPSRVRLSSLIGMLYLPTFPKSHACDFRIHITRIWSEIR